MFFAFSDKQVDEGMKTLGLEPGDTDQICGTGFGGFIKKSDKQKMIDMFDRHRKEMKDAIEADQTGDGFIYEMFDYELANHEYGYTRDISDAVRALGLSVDEINADERLLRGLKKACREQEEWYNEHN
jgi:hypothetical protein